MGTDGSSDEPTLGEALAAVERAGEPGEPMTATDVAEPLNCSRATATDRLATLVERGRLDSKRVGDATRVWWRVDGTARPDRASRRGTDGGPADGVAGRQTDAAPGGPPDGPADGPVLAPIADAAERLTAAESAAAAGDVVVETVTEALGLDDAHVYRFDTDRNSLEQVSTSVLFRSGAADAHALTAGDDSPVWTSFVTGEASVRGPGTAPVLPGRRLDRRTDLVVPLGTHGVLVAGTDDPDGLGRERRDRLELVAALAESTLARLDSEAARREREAALQERSRELDRLDRVTTVMRDVTGAIARATTDEEIRSAVCEELTRCERFRFAWIGEAAEDDQRLLPCAWSGEGRGYLDSAGVESVCPVGEPAGRAYRDEAVTVVANVAADLRSADWRSEAFGRDFQSVISVPLTAGDVTDGVLSVYADRPGVFGDLEQSVFDELGHTVANALDAVETRRALLNDQLVELEFSLAGDTTCFLTRLASATGCAASFEGAVPLGDDEARVFFTVRDADVADVHAVLERSVSVETTRHVGAGGEGHLFEAVVTGSPVPLALLDHDARLLALSADSEDARLVVGVPSSADVRRFIEWLLDRYEAAEFRARRERETPLRTRQGFRFALAESLTDRQLEVLKTAYLSGYFASPRRRTGSELGETLGISQPTVTEHLRAAQGKLLDLLFADDPTTPE